MRAPNPWPAIILISGLISLGCQNSEPAKDSPEAAQPSSPTPSPPPEPNSPIALEQYTIRVADPALPCVVLEYDQRFDVPYASLTLRGIDGAPACTAPEAGKTLASMFEAVREHMRPLDGNRIPIFELEVLNIMAGWLPNLVASTAKPRTKLCDAARDAGLDGLLETLVQGTATNVRCAHGHAQGKDWVGRRNPVITRLVYRVEPEAVGPDDAPMPSANRLPLSSTPAAGNAPATVVAQYTVVAKDEAACVSVGYSYSRFDVQDPTKESPRGRVRIRSGWNCQNGTARDGQAPKEEELTRTSKSMLRGIQEQAGPSFRVDGASTFALGQQFYERLARAALASPKWDNRRGWAKDAGRFEVGKTYDLVCDLVNEAHAHANLSEVLKGVATNVHCEGLEKLFVPPVSELPFSEALVAEGVSASRKVPQGASYYFSARPVL